MTLYLYSSICPAGHPFVTQTGVSNICQVTCTDSAPKLKIDISTLNGTVTTTVLLDSGADISVAGISILSQLNEHINNLLPSFVPPKAMNGAEMCPVGRLPVCFKGNTMMTCTFTLILQAH